VVGSINIVRESTTFGSKYPDTSTKNTEITGAQNNFLEI
jgi:hypothetical protein